MTTPLTVKIEWTPEKLESFQARYEEVMGTNPNVEWFDWDGFQFVPAYAKYLIMYLRQAFGLDPSE